MSVNYKKLAPGEIIPLNLDFMFTSIFNKEENIDILENFLSCYLEIPLEEIKGNLKLIKRNLEIKEKLDSKKEIDLLLNYKGKKINIELSNKYSSKALIDRNIVYACNIHSRQLKSGDKNYSDIKETIQINLNNFSCNERDIKEEYYLTTYYGKIISKKFRIDFVDIEMGCKMWYPNINNKLSRWCKVITARNEEELREVLGEDLMEDTSKTKLVGEINKLSSDNEYVELYTELSREELEKNTLMIEAEEKGIEKGIEIEKINIAKGMLNENIDIDIISKITGLSIDEIKNIK